MKLRQKHGKHLTQYLIDDKSLIYTIRNRVYGSRLISFNKSDGIENLCIPMSNFIYQLPHKYLLYKWMEDTHLSWWCYIAQVFSWYLLELPVELVYEPVRERILLLYSLFLLTKKGNLQFHCLLYLSASVPNDLCLFFKVKSVLRRQRCHY